MYKIQPKNLPKASSVLARAFTDYPLFKYVLPDSASRTGQLAHLCRFLLRLGMAKGVVIAPSEALEGVSIWLPSEGSANSAIDALRAGLLDLFLHVDIRAIGRFIEIGRVKARTRNGIVGGSYWLCDMIGVDPVMQGRGAGRQMVETELDRLDEARMACYLETSEAGNVVYYEKHGFDLIHQYKIHNVPVFCLQWKPGAQRTRIRRHSAP